jgi:hypothetical protein
MSERTSHDMQRAWTRARAAYLAGDTAAEVCRRFGIGRSAFFAAARAGGWRRADAAAALPAPDGEATPPVPQEARPCFDLAEAALARASQAVMAGRLHEAQGWTRLVGELRRLSVQETGQPDWAETVGEVGRHEEAGRRIAAHMALEPGAGDSETLDFGASESGASEPGAADSSVDSLRTPIPVLTRCKKRLIVERPDSVDSPFRSGLFASTTPRLTYEQVRAMALERGCVLEAEEDGP